MTLRCSAHLRPDLPVCASRAVPLLAVAFFSGGALTQTFEDVMRPSNTHLLVSPNAATQPAAR
jgi:hypothetical protein